jgi:hypothetical protein
VNRGEEARLSAFCRPCIVKLHTSTEPVMSHHAKQAMYPLCAWSAAAGNKARTSWQILFFVRHDLATRPATCRQLTMYLRWTVYSSRAPARPRFAIGCSPRENVIGAYATSTAKQPLQS